MGMCGVYVFGGVGVLPPSAGRAERDGNILNTHGAAVRMDLLWVSKMFHKYRFTARLVPYVVLYLHGD